MYLIRKKNIFKSRPINCLRKLFFTLYTLYYVYNIIVIKDQNKQSSSKIMFIMLFFRDDTSKITSVKVNFISITDSMQSKKNVKLNSQIKNRMLSNSKSLWPVDYIWLFWGVRQGTVPSLYRDLKNWTLVIDGAKHGRINRPTRL